MAADGEDQRRSIPQTNALVRALIEQETLDHPFWVNGIVTRFYLSHLSHIYFDLVDDNYSISCMVREKLRGTLNFTITNSLEIDVYGTLRVFENKAQVQIEVEKARLIERPAFVMDATNGSRTIGAKRLVAENETPFTEKYPQNWIGNQQTERCVA